MSENNTLGLSKRADQLSQLYFRLGQLQLEKSRYHTEQIKYKMIEQDIKVLVHTINMTVGE